MKKKVQNKGTMVLLAVLAGCINPPPTSGPSLDRLYFPAGIAHVDVAGQKEGVLFVANANFDKRYASGSIVALALDTLGLPSLGSSGPGVRTLVDLKVSEKQSVQIASFAGDLTVQKIAPSSYRLYVPTRSEGMRIYQAIATMGVDGPTLSCVHEASRNCVETGSSLSPSAFERSDAGVQWALTPYGVATAPRECSLPQDCCTQEAPDCKRGCNAGQCMGTDGQPFADIWVTYSARFDASNLLSGTSLQGYLARLDSDSFSLSEKGLLPIGLGPSNSVVAAGSWVYVSGRIFNPAPNLMRAVNREGAVVASGLESAYRVADARGLALSSDGKRMFIAGRYPNTLLVVSVTPDGQNAPRLGLLRGVPLPETPNEVRVIPRQGQGDLVAVTCTSASSLVLYDDDLGDLASWVGEIGTQPFSMAVDVRGAAARIFVSDFGDGRIAVIDVPDLKRPQGARLVAQLGAQQVCLTRGASSPACLASQGVSP